MLDDFFVRQDVSSFMKEIIFNSRYFDKRIEDSFNYQLFVDVSLPLFLFFDALFKFKIIIDDMKYFDDYFKQVRKLMKRIDNFHDIQYGIYRIIGRTCSFQLGLKEVESLSSKEKLLKRIYERYIDQGYFFCEILPIDCDKVLKENYIEYKNQCQNPFLEVDKILQKYGFSDYLMACLRSFSSPSYLSSLLSSYDGLFSKADKSAYFRCDYKSCFHNLDRFLSKLEVSEYDRGKIVSICKQEWTYLDREHSRPLLMLIPRKDFVDNSYESFSLFFSRCQKDSLGDCLEKIFTPRYHDISFSTFSLEAIRFVSFPNYLQVSFSKNFAKVNQDSFLSEQSFFSSVSNAYGKASWFLLFGAILITLGVIVTIFYFYRL